MFSFKSITTKFIFISLLILSLIAIFIFSSFQLTRHIRDGAAKVNLAGKLRYHQFEMVWLAHNVIMKTKAPGLRQTFLSEIKYKMDMFEKITEGLKNGSEELGILPLEYKEGLMLLNKFTHRWDKDLKPMLLKILELPAKEASVLLDEYDLMIQGYVDDIDIFAQWVEDHCEMEAKKFNFYRIYLTALFISGAFFYVFYIKHSIVIPLRKLRYATSEIERGNFDLRIDVKSSDEIGKLSQSFNRMAQTINMTFDEKTKLLENLEALASFPEKNPYPIVECDMDCNITYLNPAARKLIDASGIKENDLLPSDVCKLAMGSEALEKEISYCELKVGDIVFGEYIHLMPDKETIRVYAYEITEQKQAEEDLMTYTGDIFALANSSNVISAVPMTENIYEAICNIAIKNFDFKMVWLGLTEEASDDVKPVAQSSFEWDNSPADMGPIGMSLKTKDSMVINTIDTNLTYAPWSEEALKRGYRSFMAVALINSEARVIGVLNLYSSVPQFFTKRRQHLFRVFANYASVAIENRALIKGLEKKVKERTKELEEAKVMAETASKAKSDFLANMSHEVRTPLNSIIGFSEMMFDGMIGPLNDKQKEFLGDVIDSAKHLLSLINDILDLSKVEAGKMELEPGEFNMKELVESSLVMFKKKVIKHNIKTSIKFEEEIDNVFADERKIRQVLFNLLSNALKFTPDGGSVSVRVRKVRGGSGLRAQDTETADYGTVEISVEDTGVGIPEESRERLFQPFEQLESIYLKRHEGTGLGLTLCKKIVELHGGRIWFESKVGAGSAFRFVIPVRAKIIAAATDRELSALEMIDPVINLVKSEYFLRHVERVSSLHKRTGRQFGLLYFEMDTRTKPEDIISIANILKKTIREHEIIAHGKDFQSYYVVLFDVDNAIVDKVISRTNKVLIESGHAINIKSKLSEEDGENIEEMLKTLNNRN